MADAERPPLVRQETLIEAVEKGDVDTVDSNLRYIAYLARLRPLLLPATRYLAYTSDVGEAFRPVVSPKLVTAAYGVSWLYLGGDVAYEGYKGHLAYTAKKNAGIPSMAMPSEMQEVGLAVAKRAIFQSTASMLLPAFTIHSVVKHSGPLFKTVKNPKIRGWGPTVAGLAVVPFLPFIFDKPVEHILDKAWEPVERYIDPIGHPVELEKGEGEL